MTAIVMRHALAAALILYAAPVLAQTGGHTMPGSQQPAAPAGEQVSACVQSQQQVSGLIETASRRLDLARQTNDPAAMRGAMDDLQATLSMVKTQLSSCAQLAASAPAVDPHAGHVMPGAPAAPGSTAPTAADPHAEHAMPKPQLPGTAAPRGTAPAKPGTTEPAPAAADPHAGHAMPTPSAPKGAAKPAPPMDHSKMQMGGEAKAGKAMDPVNGLMIDPATAPKTTYQGQTYYFSSEQTLKEFLQNPAKFAKKPKR